MERKEIARDREGKMERWRESDGKCGREREGEERERKKDGERPG